VLTNRLRDVLELCWLTQVITRLHKLVHEGHGLEYVGELDGAFILIDIQKVGQHDPLRKDALNFVEHLVSLLLYLCVALGYATIDQAHANWPDLVDEGLGDGVEEVLDRVDLQLESFHARVVLAPAESFLDEGHRVNEFRIRILYLIADLFLG